MPRYEGNTRRNYRVGSKYSRRRKLRRRRKRQEVRKRKNLPHRSMEERSH